MNLALAHLLGGCCALAALATVGSSQTHVLGTFYGENHHDSFGTSVSNAGDVNADGFDDIVVGAHEARVGGVILGRVYVLSGKDSAYLYTFDSPQADVSFGTSVSGAGDVNGDGHDDVIVGAYRATVNGAVSGCAWVYSGSNGAVLHTFPGPSAYARQGKSVSGAGDVNADGFDDLVVGAPTYSSSAGIVQVYSGLDGTILYSNTGSSHSKHVGEHVSGAGDVNADGHDDYIVEAPGDGGPSGANWGRVRVYSGADGSELHSVLIYDRDDVNSCPVSGAGDVNADGYDDFMIGEHRAYTSTTDGRVRIFSGLDGAVLHTILGPDGSDFGFSVSDVGDVNGDGHDDVIVGGDRESNWRGVARVLSGLDGAELFRAYGDYWSDRFGRAVSGAGDVNQDGIPDFVVGTWTGKHPTLGDTGLVRVFSGVPLPYPTYCAANPNSTGAVATISATGSGSILDNDLVLKAEHLVPGQTGIFFCGATRIQAPFGDGFRCAGGQLLRMNPPSVADGNGVSLRAFDFTAPPVSTFAHDLDPGTTWHFQYWYRDPAGAGSGFNLTGGMSVPLLY